MTRSVNNVNSMIIPKASSCSRMSIGHKGMVYASKALGMTMADLFTDKKLVEEGKKDFKINKTNPVYQPRILPGPPKLN